MTYGALLMMAGAAFVIAGWITLYRGVKKGVVVGGIYSYSRHPQYFGFILIVVGWLFGWPTIITLAFAPVLVYKYVRVCRTEEREILGRFPAYRSYMQRTPFFI